METMTDQGHLESAVYMIRNLYTGDDEQTRIEDEPLLEELPEDLRTGCKFLLSDEGDWDYDGACLMYIRWHLKQVIHEWFYFDDHKEDFEKACTTIYDSLWGLTDRGEREELSEEELKDIEEWRVETKEWTRMALEILKAA